MFVLLSFILFKLNEIELSFLEIIFRNKNKKFWFFRNRKFFFFLDLFCCIFCSFNWKVENIYVLFLFLKFLIMWFRGRDIKIIWFYFLIF